MIRICDLKLKPLDILKKLIPSIIKIEVNQHYSDGFISPECTATSCYFWNGYVYYKWLCFTICQRIDEDRDFEIYNDKIEFKFHVPENTQIVTNYNYDKSFPDKYTVDIVSKCKKNGD
jgi:hypothetical protein